MNRIEIREYITGDGANPFRSWLLSMKDIQARARVRTRLDRISLGNFGDVRFVGRGVYELRFHYGPGYRVYFGRIGQTVVLLLVGGDKKTQQKDIIIAQTYWENFRNVS